MRQYRRLNFVASWTNSLNFMIDESEQVRTIVRTKFVPLTSCYKYKKRQILDLEGFLDQYCNVLPAFSFSSAKNDLNFLKTFFMLNLNNKWEIEPPATRKSNHFFLSQNLNRMFFKSGFSGTAYKERFWRIRMSWFFWKCTKHKGPKKLFTYRWVHPLIKLSNTELSPWKFFFINVLAVYFIKQNTKVVLTRGKLDWTKTNLLSNWIYQINGWEKSQIINTCKKHEIRNEKARSTNFVLLKLQNCCSKLRGNAGKDGRLPQQRQWYVKALIHIIKTSAYFFAELYR